MNQPDDSTRDLFREQGFIGPITVFDRPTCKRVSALLKRDFSSPAEWPKGHAATSRLHYEIACLPQITELIGRLQSGPLMLWGSSLIVRLPAQRHTWHTDIETGHDSEKTVSVWIGLEGTNSGSGLQLVKQSHRFGQPLQAIASQHDIRTHAITDRLVETWAKELSEESGIVRPDIFNGQAIVFDGRLWHGTANQNRLLPRRALLLQYAAPDVPIRRPDPNNTAWPFRVLQHPRPPSIMIIGSGTNAMNKLVPPPPNAFPSDIPRLSTVVHQLPDPIPESADKKWRAHAVLNGQTTQVLSQTCHVSVLSPQAIPHAPHQHLDEEILLMLSGQAELQIVDDASGETTHQTLRERQFVFYPRHGVHHTLCNKGQNPAIYLMLKWRGRTSDQVRENLTAGVYSLEDAFVQAQARRTDFATETILDGHTEYLRNLHVHVSLVQPGAGYAAHVDAHDVAIVLLDGEIETLGQRLTSPGIVYYAGGEAHGLKNIGQTVAKYLVIEFHGQRNSTLMPVQFDKPNLKVWIRLMVKKILARSSLLEGIVRKLASLRRSH